jgi:hypothetical protein
MCVSGAKPHLCSLLIPDDVPCLPTAFAAMVPARSSSISCCPRIAPGSEYLFWRSRSRNNRTRSQTHNNKIFIRLKGCLIPVWNNRTRPQTHVIKILFYPPDGLHNPRLVVSRQGWCVSTLPSNFPHARLQPHTYFATWNNWNFHGFDLHGVNQFSCFDVNSILSHAPYPRHRLAHTKILLQHKLVLCFRQNGEGYCFSCMQSPY